MTSILVTGGAGYIGSHTCKALRHSGYDPITYDNLQRGNPESRLNGVRSKSAISTIAIACTTRLRGTVQLPSFTPRHLLMSGGESNLNPTLYYQNNVGGTAALLDTMRECGVGKIVFSSSCAVYGAPAVVPVPEETPYAPINPYGASKMICERMLRECATAFPLSFIALRYFNAAGADPEGEIGECHVPETHVDAPSASSSGWSRQRFHNLW